MNYISKILIKLLKSRLILLKQALTLNRVRAVFLCLILITSFSLLNFMDAPQQLYPQCLQCSSMQGAEAAGILRELGL